MIRFPFIIRYISFLIILVLVNSCSINHKVKGIREGEIRYKITYLKDATENPLIGLMPTELNMVFKDNNVSMSVEGWMGIFKSSFIKRNKNSEMITLLKIMNKKVYCQSATSTGLLGVDDFSNMSISFDNLTREILDFKCNHAIASIPEKQMEFDIYYTRDIQIEQPNSNTPFEEIPGVLMQFQMQMDGIPMQLVADKLTKFEVPENVFDIPDEYQKISIDQMDEIFKSLRKSDKN